MCRVRQQRHRVGQQTEADFSRNESDIQGGANGEGAIMPCGVMMVVVCMIVTMVRHTILILPRLTVIGQARAS